MIPEERAAKIVHRMVSPQSSWEQFERVLLSHQRPDWNRHVAYVADEIREAIQEGVEAQTARARATLDLLLSELEHRFNGLEKQIMDMGGEFPDANYEHSYDLELLGDVAPLEDSR